MARVTVWIPDDLEAQVKQHLAGIGRVEGVAPSYSALVQDALREALRQPPRYEASARGLAEALREVRTASAALKDLETRLISDRPSRRHAKRVR